MFSSDPGIGGKGDSEAMKIAVGSDHRGFVLKGKLIRFLQQNGFEVADLGVHRETPPSDYPDIAARLARRVAGGAFDRGLLICGTGIGMSIAANKIKGIRAARCASTRDARLCRQHNEANVLTLGGLTLSSKKAKAIVAIWLKTDAEGGRHRRRVRKIGNLERGLGKGDSA